MKLGTETSKTSIEDRRSADPQRGAFWRTILQAIVLLIPLCVATAAPGAGIDFAREIEPILIKRCSECHGPDKQKSKLRLDSRESDLAGGGFATTLGVSQTHTTAPASRCALSLDAK